MNKNYNEINLINIQLLATLGFIVALIISYLLSYNQKLILEKKEKLFTNKTSQDLSLIQSTLLLTVSFVFLYINYSRYKSSNNKKDFLLQIETSILALISSFIGIYLVIKNYNKNFSLSEIEM